MQYTILYKNDGAWMMLSSCVGMRRVAARFILKSLNFLQKQECVDVAKEMLEHIINDDTFLKRIVTGDEI